MKLNCNVVISEVAGETLAIPMNRSFHGVIKVNGTAGYILECLKNETSEKEITEKLTEKYDVSLEKAGEDAGKIIGTLRKAGLLEE